jgi:hypothetical protein
VSLYPTTFWCEQAWLGSTDGSVAAGVLLTINGDRIASVASGVAAPADAVVLRGLTLPGMANAHSHAFHRGMRGRTHGGTGSFWSWRDQMYALAARLNPDTYLQLATATFAEMALAGFTAVGEFHYLHHDPVGRAYSDPNAMGAALIEAARTVGVRFTLLDTCYLRGGLDATGGDIALNDVQRRGRSASTNSPTTAPPASRQRPTQFARSTPQRWRPLPNGRQQGRFRCTCTSASNQPRTTSALLHTAARQLRCCTRLAPSPNAPRRCMPPTCLPATST